MDTCYPDPLSSSTTEEAKCIPCGYRGCVRRLEIYKENRYIQRGNVAEHFLKSLMREQWYIKDILSHIEPLVMTDEDEDKFQTATHYHICEKPFTSSTIRCKDHNHLTGAFVETHRFLPISKCFSGKLIESCEKETFEWLRQEIDKAHLLFRKGVYPYDYMDDFDKFKGNRLPAREKIYNKLTRTHISQEDYEYAQQVWNEFNINTMGDYHDLYLKTDVLTLACVFSRTSDRLA
ncbi:Hypothetical predicted protein [Mytilus galloprovincialis]|uniref:Uncharacterized protein n=1 Tax=Mytilus galloprovincialis TaxID=29158 RepID=A0A8B6C6V3_MYTGA|nr:Hypothetical predicted protein [Mytilus galloprovincialis]